MGVNQLIGVIREIRGSESESRRCKLNQILLEGVADHLGVGGEAEFLEDT